MRKKKEQWEEEAKDHFIADLKAQGRGDWIVSDSDVVVDKQTNRNFDYQLQCGTDFIALEIFRLVEKREEIIWSKSWSTIANSIAAELRTRGIKGYTIHAPNAFDVPRLKIPGFVSKITDRLEVALKQNPQTDPITVDGFEIKRIDDFPDVSLFTTGPGGAINPTGIAHDFIAEKLPTKNKQLNIANHERVVLIVNWAGLESISYTTAGFTLRFNQMASLQNESNHCSFHGWRIIFIGKTFRRTGWFAESQNGRNRCRGFRYSAASN
jgi:hypothetical protein